LSAPRGRRGAPTHLAPGYSLAARGGEGRVLDDGGHIVVGVRGCVPAGGGETRTGEAGPEYCQTRRELDLPGGRKGLYGRWFPDTRDRVLTSRISL
jgi:hypothetical protein